MTARIKVVVPGGAGDMGSRTVEDLAGTDDVELVTIADRNVAAARALAGRLAGAKARVEVRAVDAGDHASLVRAMRGHDVVASALGPFHRFETALVSAAIEAETDYVSICDEWQAAAAVLDECGGRAERAGRTIVTGMGASPGISNIGVRYLADQMDQVRRAHIFAFQPLDSGGGEAVFQHLLFIMSGEMAIWRDGKQQMVRACSDERVVDFPRFGPVKLWNMGHSEPYTIPRFMPGIEEVCFFLGFGRGSELFVRPAQWGLFSTRGRIDAAAKILTRLERWFPKHERGVGAIRVEAWGTAGGRDVHRMLCGLGTMRDATGLSLSVGALLVGRKELSTTKGGVYPPEACMRPRAFIRAMAAKGLTCYEDLEMTRQITGEE